MLRDYYKEDEQIPSQRLASKNEVCLFLGITSMGLDNWLRKGLPYIKKGGQGIPYVFDLKDVILWRYCGGMANSGTNPDKLPPGERKLWYEGESKRMDLQLRNKELLKAADVEQTLATAFSTIAQSLLSLPDTLERRAGTPPEQLDLVTDIIHEAMTGLMEKLQSVTAGDIELLIKQAEESDTDE